MSKKPTFARFLRLLGFKPTPAQRVLCLVAFDGAEPRELEGTDRDIAKLLFGDVDEVPARARETLAIVKGARIGGSLLSAYRLLHLALTVDLPTLAPGERAVGLIVGPDLRLARQVLRYAIGAARGEASIEHAISAVTSDGFVLTRPDGCEVSIEALPATRGGSAVRGRTLVGAVLTEAAFFRDDSFVVNDAEVLRAVGPRVVEGGQVIIESTPWLEDVILYDLFTSNWGAPDTALAVHAPTLLMRPDERTRSYVERERRRDPDNAAREFDATFLGGGSAIFFDPSTIAACVSESAALGLPALAGTTTAAGADLALTNDSSALAVVGERAGHIELLELVEKRPAKGSPLKLSAVIADFAETLKRYDLACFTADGHVREPAREHAEEHKVEIDAAPEGRTGKTATYVALRQAMAEGRVSLPRHDRLLSQLRAVVSKPAPGGGLILTSPRRAGQGHGDLVSALVLAHHAVTAGASTYEPLLVGRISGRDDHRSHHRR